MKAIFAFLFLTCISIGYGLKCYKCASIKDWEDCEKNKEEETCPTGFDRCGKVEFSGRAVSVGFEGFSKGCSQAATCNKNLCKVLAQAGATIDKCDVHCCEDDKCNGAKVPMASAFLLFACTVVVFFR